jgi:hypothetical protein
MAGFGLYFKDGLSQEDANALRKRLNDLAASYGFLSERGPTAGDGNLSELLMALDSGKLMLVSEDQQKQIEALMYLAGNLQALANNAEVFAPELLSNNSWIAMKTFLEQRSDELGVTAFIRQVGKRRREALEAQEEQEEEG